MRRELVDWLPGRRITGVELLAPEGPKYAGLGRALGQVIEAVDRRGKFLLLPLSGGLELVAHLGMTGVIAQEPPVGAKAGHVRVRLGLGGTEPNVLYFIDPRRFGRFLVVGRGEYADLPTLAALGPEPLGDAFTAASFGAALGRSRMSVKTYLLSQRPVAGVGNIYADEALWRAGVHPLSPSAELSPEQVERLHRALQEVLAAAVEAQGTTLADYRTVKGGTGEYSESLDVYGRAGKTCPRCGSTLERLVVGQRGTTVCPTCQRPPGAAATPPSRPGSRASARRQPDPHGRSR